MKLLPLSLSLFVSLAVATPVLAETSFIPWSYTGPDLFPSAIVSSTSVDWNGNEQRAEDQRTGHDPDPNGYNLPIYGDEHGWLGVELQDLAKGSEVEVKIAVDGILKSASWKGVVQKTTPSGRARIKPNASWDYPELQKVRQQRPVNVSFNVSVNGSALPEKTATYQLKSLNDCVIKVFWDSLKQRGSYDDLGLLVAGYVNENHPYVDLVLKAALSLRTVDSIAGYQGDEMAVLKQVFAIWNVLQRHGIQYSSITNTTPSKLALAQTVRFFDQCIDGKQANCVDGSALMASILTKMGIETDLVLVPGHCFLRFALRPAPNAEYRCLETTMLGDNSLTLLGNMDMLTEAQWNAEQRASVNTFLKAIQKGDGELKQQLTVNKNEVFIISITRARKDGIMPLAFTPER